MKGFLKFRYDVVCFWLIVLTFDASSAKRIASTIDADVPPDTSVPENDVCLFFWSNEITKSDIDISFNGRLMIEYAAHQREIRVRTVHD